MKKLLSLLIVVLIIGISSLFFNCSKVNKQDLAEDPPIIILPPNRITNNYV
jgi:uncharacterized protein YneF (UPF0154 family)